MERLGCLGVDSFVELVLEEGGREWRWKNRVRGGWDVMER